MPAIRERCQRRRRRGLCGLRRSNSCTSWAWKTEIQAQLLQCIRHHCYDRSLPYRRLQMESHRASSVLRDLQKLEPPSRWTAMKECSNSFVPPVPNRLGCDCLPGPQRVSDRAQTRSTADLFAPSQTQQHPAEMELHHCAESVKVNFESSLRGTRPSSQWSAGSGVGSPYISPSASGLPPIRRHPFSDRVVRLVHAIVRAAVDGDGSLAPCVSVAYTSLAVSNVRVTSTPKSHSIGAPGCVGWW